MPGRGDNNQHGSAGRGSSNQSNQPFVTQEDSEPKSDHNKKTTGGKPSDSSPRTVEPDADRNLAHKDSKKKSK